MMRDFAYYRPITITNKIYIHCCIWMGISCLELILYKILPIIYTAQNRYISVLKYVYIYLYVSMNNFKTNIYVYKGKNHIQELKDHLNNIKKTLCVLAA